MRRIALQRGRLRTRGNSAGEPGTVEPPVGTADLDGAARLQCSSQVGTPR